MTKRFPYLVGGWVGALYEGRNPKAEIRKQTETRDPKNGRGQPVFSDFGLRASFGLRISAFGFGHRIAFCNRLYICACVLLVSALLSGRVAAQETSTGSDERIIQYNSTTGLADPVALLEKKIKQGEAHLDFEPDHGYLRSLLENLHVPVSAQGLVFSKTSSQRARIGPQSPRAVYFGDDVCVGWVPGGDVIELAAIDPKRGTVFYTLAQRAGKQADFARRTDCLQCHQGPKTLFLPGLLVRSVYTGPDGTPLEAVDGFVSGHNSSLERRWGGWYVTGTHQGELHHGNTFLTNDQSGAQFDLTAGANVTNLSSRFDTSRYLSPDSDLVALLVFEHEIRMHNLITHAGYEARCALQSQPGGSSAGPSSDWARARIAQAGEMLLEYMLFRNEAPLKGRVQGTTPFAREFEQDGPRDSKGRSLRQLDLQTRLLRYPCSFLIYSAGFDALPDSMKHYLWERLDEILNGRDRSPTYANMNPNDRQAIREILLETKPEFAAWVENSKTREHERISPEQNLTTEPNPPLDELIREAIIPGESKVFARSQF